MPHIITVAEYLGDKPEQYPEDLTDEIIENTGILLERVNLLLANIPDLYYVFHGINSGWRPRAYNEELRAQGIKAAKNSRHISAQAIDLTDRDDRLDNLLFTHQDLLVHADLYAEWPSSTIGWCHLQSVAPLSGNRYFRP